MIARHRVVTTGVLLSLIGHASPAAARGSRIAADPLWNSEHIARLPKRIGKAFSRPCKSRRKQPTTAPPMPRTRRCFGHKRVAEGLTYCAGATIDF